MSAQLSPFISLGVYLHCFVKLRDEAPRPNTDVLIKPLPHHCLSHSLTINLSTPQPNTDVLIKPSPHHCLSHSLTINLSTPRLFSPSHPPKQNKVDPACLQGEASTHLATHRIKSNHFILESRV